MSTTYQLSPAVHIVHDTDGAVLLDPERGVVYGLNPTAGVIVQGLQDGLDLEQIAHRVRDTFTDIEGEPHDDIVALVEQLLGAGLLVRTADDARR
jgi:S1-C subfamily serine protease